jgi:hypothetical protein
MDQATLVGRQIDDVTKLIDQLRRDHFDVMAAFWLYRSEADEWFLHIVSDAVDQDATNEPYKAVYGTMRRIPDLGIEPFQVKLVSPNDPVARAVLDLLSRQRFRLPARVRGTKLGDVYIEDAYIYHT